MWDFEYSEAFKHISTYIHTPTHINIYIYMKKKIGKCDMGKLQRAYTTFPVID